MIDVVTYGITAPATKIGEKMESTQVSIGGWMGKENVVHIDGHKEGMKSCPWRQHEWN